MRLAFIDLMFSWPPHGGADVDVYHVLDALAAANHEVHLFGVAEAGSWERGTFDPAHLPFLATRIEIEPRQFAPKQLRQRLAEYVTAWRPDGVVIADGFFMKPLVMEALHAFPLVVRYFAHELGCHRDIVRFKNGAPCPNHYLHTPDTCRACALAALGTDIRRGYALAWHREYMAARAYSPQYYEELRRNLKRACAAIVYNRDLEKEFRAFFPEVFVVPGGVDPMAFPCSPVPIRKNAEKKIILMLGRAEDPLKGAVVLREAGALLRETRDDFEIRVSLPEDAPRSEWFVPIGWCSHQDTPALYAGCDIAVVPSLWEEPFGMVAVEAMACGRPVVASRVGGLKETVLHGETGLLFERGSAPELAAHLATLLDNAELRSRMGTAGRERVMEQFTWDQVVSRGYAPVLSLIERLGRR